MTSTEQTLFTEICALYQQVSYFRSKDDELQAAILFKLSDPRFTPELLVACLTTIDVMDALIHVEGMEKHYINHRLMTPELLYAIFKTKPHELLFKSQHVPKAMFEDLVNHQRDYGKAFIEIALANPKCPVAISLQYFDSEYFSVRQAATLNPNLDLAVINGLINRELQADGVVSSFYLAHPKCPVTILRSEYNADLGKSYKEVIVANPNCPLTILREVLTQNVVHKQELTQHILSNAACPLNFLVEYWREPHWRASIIRNPQCPSTLLISAVSGDISQLEGTLTAVKHPQITGKGLVLGVTHAKRLVVATTLLHPSAPPYLRRLAFMGGL